MNDKKKLEKLIIYSFSNRDFSDSNLNDDAEKKFVSPINPESFTKNHRIENDVRRGLGNNGTDVRFKSIVPEELRLEFILDGTKTMEGYWEEYKDKPVNEQLEIFSKATYKIKDNIHRPYFLMIIWGKEFKLRCVLSNLDVNYTLFNPDGSPLRAKLTATFLSYRTQEESLAQDRQSSPDLTHVRQVNASDRLDLMTHSIYNNPKYLLQVAQVNGLTSIRKIKAGGELYFPPFKKTGA